MYRMLLRCVVSGKKKWFDKCYYAGKVKKNTIILWKGPDDDTKKKYKILAFKWEGFDKRLSLQDKNFIRIADEFLLSLNLPPEWRDELSKYIDEKKVTRT